MRCPYCRQRDAALTLSDENGTYHLCRVCAVQWGIEKGSGVSCNLYVKADQGVARAELRELEYLWTLPCAEWGR